MTAHVCQIHGAPCRGRESQDHQGKVRPALTADELERANRLAAEVADDLVNQRTRTA